MFSDWTPLAERGAGVPAGGLAARAYGGHSVPMGHEDGPATAAPAGSPRR